MNSIKNKNKNNLYNTDRKIKIPENYAKELAMHLDIDLQVVGMNQWLNGINTELQHGTVNPLTNITDDDVVITAKIAAAHLHKIPDYYIRLAKMEKEAGEYWLHRLHSK
jgi:hypothetical protein